MNPEAIAAMILQGCDTADRTIDAAMATAPGLVRAALDHVRVFGLPLPGPAKDLAYDLIMGAARRAAEILREAIDIIRILARSVGRPTLLRTAATQIQTDVVDAAETLGSSMSLNDLEATDSDAWDSPAAESYESAFSDQARNVDGISEVGRSLVRLLNDMAASIESFYGELQWAYFGLLISVGGLVVAIVTAAPTLGVGTIIGLIASVAGVIVSVASVVMAFTNSSSRNAGLAEELSSAPAIEWKTSAFAV